MNDMIVPIAGTNTLMHVVAAANSCIRSGVHDARLSHWTTSHSISDPPFFRSFGLTKTTTTTTGTMSDDKVAVAELSDGDASGDEATPKKILKKKKDVATSGSAGASATGGHRGGPANFYGASRKPMKGAHGRPTPPTAGVPATGGTAAPATGGAATATGGAPATGGAAAPATGGAAAPATGGPKKKNMGGRGRVIDTRCGRCRDCGSDSLDIDLDKIDQFYPTDDQQPTGGKPTGHKRDPPYGFVGDEDD
jgi:hypothetical protein